MLNGEYLGGQRSLFGRKCRPKWKRRVVGRFLPLWFIFTGILTQSCTDASKDQSASLSFPSEMVSFRTADLNPIFAGTGDSADWDQHIRERGYILREDEVYHLWYTGYQDKPDAELHLGYATSPDGIHFTRYPDNPIFAESWTEDMMVLKDGDRYLMFAEGRHDIAHWLTSGDKIHWSDRGSLGIRKTDGSKIDPGPYGTPTVWKEESMYYLFYERNDSAIWLATSRDLNTWTNLQDDPVIDRGPEWYDKYGVALNQIVKYKGLYYGYYHGTPQPDWSLWNTNVAVSQDLIHWTKYKQNPILEENKSSGILVPDDEGFRMYTMHPEGVMHEKK